MVRLFLFALIFGLAGCSGPSGQSQPPAGTNIVTVIGAIHGQHRRSTSYSLDLLEAAIRKFRPDVVMVELPPDRFAIALENYDRFGEVRESRTDDFPELVDVVFPLRRELGFEMIPVAAWTQEIADNRRAVMAKIEKDPKRAEDWATWQALIAAYGKAVSGRSDDPLFVHGEDYDAAVKARQESNQRLFGDDLGAGGWQAINTAHFAMITKALDELSGQEKRILILYGAWHKYWFLESLESRKDIQLVNAASLF